MLFKGFMAPQNVQDCDALEHLQGTEGRERNDPPKTPGWEVIGVHTRASRMANPREGGACEQVGGCSREDSLLLQTHRPLRPSVPGGADAQISGMGIGVVFHLC